MLLVGSLPASTTEEAFRSGAEMFGDMVFALPDGETGPRTAWVSYEREGLARTNPGVEVVKETESPTGRPRHAYETPIFAVKEGVTELHWDTLAAHRRRHRVLRGVRPPARRGRHPARACASRSGCRSRRAR